MSATATKTPTRQMQIIDKMYVELETILAVLSARWHDERAYENIANYANIIKSWLPAGVRLTKMLKRPFGFQFTVEGFNAEYSITVSAREYRWKRIG